MGTSSLTGEGTATESPPAPVLPQHLHHPGGSTQPHAPRPWSWGRSAEVSPSPHRPACSPSALRCQSPGHPTGGPSVRPAQTGTQIHQEQFVVALGLGLDEEPLEFLRRGTASPSRLGGSLQPTAGLLRSRPSCRLLQRRAAGGVASPDHGVGRSWPNCWVRMSRPLFFSLV